MMRDRSWMYRCLTVDGFIRDEFVNGVNEFIHFTRSNTTFMLKNKIRCPYSRCSNNKFLCEDKVTEDILNRGFIGAYTIWSLHGEHDVGQSSRSRDRIKPYASNEEHEEYGEPIYDEEIENPYSRMVRDAIGLEVAFNYGCKNESRFMEEDPNPNAFSYYFLLSTIEEPLWSGCTKHTTLSVVSQLLNVKSEYNLSESCFDRLLEIIKNMLPSDETLPTDFYRLKKEVAKLGLGISKFMLAKNNCMLFWMETANFEHCMICGHPRFKLRKSSVKKQKKIPYKILRYLPLIPRLQRLYMSCKTAEYMTWHVQNQSDDGVLKHPVDGKAWQHFNRTHDLFAMEPRNVRLGLCSDDFNPFGSTAKPYSVWPVMLCVYNLPPWMCMKQQYTFLNMVIPRKKNPS
ncbi:PREDICTED: uncharacterized protein LOC108663891 [Theobroma cacao]|uniref:Uncharacterized protein LOC108663891 n=1 Tax=Theobroma cacao TaxID=3641 RepID=A0AB32X2H2_THECC|nr:PREDICTED: uncharacterized protein LOC108663891 [Theobroma cacao]